MSFLSNFLGAVQFRACGEDFFYRLSRWNYNPENVLAISKHCDNITKRIVAEELITKNSTSNICASVLKLRNNNYMK